MHWTIEANLSEMVSAMRLAGREGAEACVFPELALPGFHREIVSLAKPHLIGRP
jgi:predicted amidohydrolase